MNIDGMGELLMFVFIIVSFSSMIALCAFYAFIAPQMWAKVAFTACELFVLLGAWACLRDFTCINRLYVNNYNRFMAWLVVIR